MDVSTAGCEAFSVKTHLSSDEYIQAVFDPAAKEKKIIII